LFLSTTHNQKVEDFEIPIIGGFLNLKMFKNQESKVIFEMFEKPKIRGSLIFKKNQNL